MSILNSRFRPIVLAATFVGAAVVAFFQYASSANIPTDILLGILLAIMLAYVVLLVLFVRAFLAWRREQVA